MWFWHDMGGWGWFMMSFWVVLIIAIVLVALSTYARRENQDDATRILDERLARGEIDIEEYEKRRRAIDSHR